jgi:hypothetical protein
MILKIDSREIKILGSKSAIVLSFVRGFQCRCNKEALIQGLCFSEWTINDCLRKLHLIGLIKRSWYQYDSMGRTVKEMNYSFNQETYDKYFGFNEEIPM